MATRISGGIGSRNVGAGARNRSQTVNIRRQIAQIMKNANKAISRINGVTPAALRHAMMPTFNTSQKLVPVDEGTLKESVYLETAVINGNHLIELGYARGGVPDYAVLVHELLDKPHEEPTQAKFLEDAFLKHQGNMARRVRDFIRKEVFKG